MTTPQKKKRFEGLIQFRDSLRLTLVCLQASLKEKFATAMQSPLIADLDSKEEDSHYLLFSKNEAVGEIEQLSQLNSSHILSRIYQIQGENLAAEIAWHSLPTGLSIWIDPKDTLSTSYIFNIIAKLCDNEASLDVRTCHNWGSFVQSESRKTWPDTCIWLTELQEKFNLDEFRIALFEQILAKGWSQFKAVETLSIASDGTYISLTIIGTLQNRGLTPKILSELYQLPSHIITINYNLVDQIDFCVPIRINSEAPLKGFIIIDNQNIKSEK